MNFNFLKSIFHKESEAKEIDSSKIFNSKNVFTNKELEPNRFGSFDIDDFVEYVPTANGYEAYLNLSVISKLLVNSLKSKSDFRYIKTSDLNYNVLYSYDSWYLNKNDSVILIIATADIYGDKHWLPNIIIHTNKEGYLGYSNELGEKANERIHLFAILNEPPIENGRKLVFSELDEYTYSLNLDSVMPGLYNALCDIYPTPSKPLTLNWKVKDGEFVKVGKTLCIMDTPLGSFAVNCKKTGFVNIGTYDIPSTYDAKSGYNFDVESDYDNLYTIYKNETLFLNERDSEVEFIWDEFTGAGRTYWVCLAGKYFDKPDLKGDAFYEMVSETGQHIYLLPQYRDDKLQLVIGAKSTEIRISKDDKFSLLLDSPDNSMNSTSETFIMSEGYYLNNHDFIDIAFSAEMSYKQLTLLCTLKCKKWRLIPNSSNRVVIEGRNESVWTAYNISGLVLCNIFKTFKDCIDIYVNNLDLDFSYAKNFEHTQEDSCYVYLMVDTTNGYYKIGMSKNPDYRESTLQSEKPSIELVCAKKYPNRQIAASIESALHKTYSSKNIRGEWFSLTAYDVEALKASLS